MFLRSDMFTRFHDKFIEVKEKNRLVKSTLELANKKTVDIESKVRSQIEQLRP